MKNRTFHKDFDQIMGEETTRQYVKDLVFQNSALAPYKEFLDKRVKRITEADMKEMALPAPESSLGQTKPDSQGKSPNPFDLGANLKDMQRACWINYELSRKPYFGFDQNSSDEEEGEDGGKAVELDKDIIERLKWEAEKAKLHDKFIEKLHQVFDPLSDIAKETTKLPKDKIGRVYNIQTGYRNRLMFKHANNEIYGLADYLDNFHYRDPNIPKKLCQEIVENKESHLENTFKEERQVVLKDMVKCKEKWTRAGGPLREKDWDQFTEMGYKEYIKHLEERFGLNYRVEKKKLTPLLGGKGGKGNFYSSRSKISQKSKESGSHG